MKKQAAKRKTAKKSTKKPAKGKPGDAKARPADFDVVLELIDAARTRAHE